MPLWSDKCGRRSPRGRQEKRIARSDSTKPDNGGFGVRAPHRQCDQRHRLRRSRTVGRRHRSGVPEWLRRSSFHLSQGGRVGQSLRAMVNEYATATRRAILAAHGRQTFCSRRPPKRSADFSQRSHSLRNQSLTIPPIRMGAYRSRNPCENGRQREVRRSCNSSKLPTRVQTLRRTTCRTAWSAISRSTCRGCVMAARGTKWIVARHTDRSVSSAPATRIPAKPRYTVTTDILMDPAGLQIVSDDLFRQNEQQRDSQLLNVESKRQTLLSRSVLLRAIAALQAAGRSGIRAAYIVDLARSASATLLGGEGGTSQSPEIIALDNLHATRSARRDEVSFVITMSVWTDRRRKSRSASPTPSSKPSRKNSIAADSEGARRTADALVSRIAELKAEVSIRRAGGRGIPAQAGLRSTQGELVSSRSMSQINQQLVEARERLSQAESRYKELTSEQFHRCCGDAVADHLFAADAVCDAEIPADAEVARSTARAIRGWSSADRTARAAERDRGGEGPDRPGRQEQSRAGEGRGRSAWSRTPSTVSSGVFSDNDAEVELRDLTREAAAKTAIYEAFLVRAREITRTPEARYDKHPRDLAAGPAEVAQLAAAHGSGRRFRRRRRHGAERAWRAQPRHMEGDRRRSGPAADAEACHRCRRCADRRARSVGRRTDPGAAGKRTQERARRLAAQPAAQPGADQFAACPCGRKPPLIDGRPALPCPFGTR